MTWQPITNLPDNWQTMIEKHRGLHELVKVWGEQRVRLENTQSYVQFMGKLRRKIAIETGVIERLYTIDRGITYLLIEHGIDVSLIPHGTTDKPAQEVVRIIRDHEEAIEQVFHFVGAQRNLSTSFIKQLHQLLTRNQEFTDGKDQFGNWGQFSLIRGDWKKHPNNPQRRDGTLHEYCPPEHVSAQMDMLITWHLEHIETGISPEVEAAWLHHRFTQIHPFQDGNGQVARNLATLIFLRSGWFPLVVLNNSRDENIARLRYIQALERADDDDLGLLIDLFADAQRQAFLSSLSLSTEVLESATSYQSALTSLAKQLQEKQTTRVESEFSALKSYAKTLADVAISKFQGVKTDMEALFSALPQSPMIRFDFAPDDDPRTYYYRYQIVETAKILDYYANLNDYKSWICLSIWAEDVTTQILLSFHNLGREYRGVMICSACAWRKSSIEDTNSAIIQNLEPLSYPPFNFTHSEAIGSLTARYQKWLDEIILLAIAYIRKGF